MTHLLQRLLNHTEKKMAANTEKPPEEERHRGGCVKCHPNTTGTYYGYRLKNATGTWLQYAGHPNDIFAPDDPLRKEALLTVFASDCECKKKKRIEQRLELMDIPPHKRHCCFQGFRRNSNYQREAYNLARGYLLREDYLQSRGVILWGGHGKGKTHLAISLYRELLQFEYRGRFIGSPSVWHVLKTNMACAERNMDREGEVSLEPMAYGQGVVLFDDLAYQGKASAWEIKEIGAFVDYCYQHEVRLITTTNLKWPGSVRNMFGATVYDRIAEMCVPIYCGGESQRVEAAKEVVVQQESEVKNDELPF